MSTDERARFEAWVEKTVFKDGWDRSVAWTAWQAAIVAERASQPAPAAIHDDPMAAARAVVPSRTGAARHGP